MEFPLHLHLHRWERRTPDWTAAAVAGFAGGAVLMVLELVWSGMSLGDAGPWRTSHLVAALLLGPEAMWSASPGFDAGLVVAALFTHYLLGIAFGLLLGFVATGFHYESNASAMAGIGAAFGALLYVVNFHVMVRWFPWFIELQGWPTFTAHVVFGLTAALLYWKLARSAPARQRLF
ncbi:hypothetical protein [Rhizobacter sp. Root1221]|jgi:hypothetical protein|uniref:hypothetical protein n=1 Tax=Rhizobacter sp. Root1221 TaxID=1736433 RepID=UPI0006F3F737|nr:hypothetical protein [Rhizobacter sp. Root1221]KQV85501.1 hypothetical protein ASC87_07380 [Rhizobacter sp. Root1221]